MADNTAVKDKVLTGEGLSELTGLIKDIASAFVITFGTSSTGDKTQKELCDAFLAGKQIYIYRNGMFWYPATRIMKSGSNYAFFFGSFSVNGSPATYATYFELTISANPDSTSMVSLTNGINVKLALYSE